MAVEPQPALTPMEELARAIGLDPRDEQVTSVSIICDRGDCNTVKALVQISLPSGRIAEVIRSLSNVRP